MAKLNSASDPRYNGRLYDWQVSRRFPGGHTYFRDRRSGRTGISDESGRRPHTTDDGVLWVDTTSRRNIIAPASSADTSLFQIPVTDVDQKNSWTLADAAEAIWVSCLFGMKISVPLGHGETMRVRCQVG